MTRRSTVDIPSQGRRFLIFGGNLKDLKLVQPPRSSKGNYFRWAIYAARRSFARVKHPRFRKSLKQILLEESLAKKCSNDEVVIGYTKITARQEIASSELQELEDAFYGMEDEFPARIILDADFSLYVVAKRDKLRKVSEGYYNGI